MEFQTDRHRKAKSGESLQTAISRVHPRLFLHGAQFQQFQRLESKRNQSIDTPAIEYSFFRTHLLPQLFAGRKLQPQK